MAASSELRAMNWPFKNPKYIFFTDFDGTITLQDSNDFLTDHLGFGVEKREQGGKNVLDGKETFRDYFHRMMGSVNKPFPECVEFLVQNIDLDPHFKAYFDWAQENEIPTVILSGGMRPIVLAILKNLIGDDAEKMDIICNEVEARPGMSIDQEDGWQIKYHDKSDFGHDKSLTIRPYAQLSAEQKPILFYAGDGVSDLSAARETDLLFAKRGRDLITYCVKEDVAFTPFSDWSGILGKVKQIVKGEVTVQEAARTGYEEYREGIDNLNGHPK